MINIGPVAMWEGIVFGLLAVGLVVGCFMKTLGGLYFLGANIIFFVILFLLQGFLIEPFANIINPAIKNMFSSNAQLAAGSIIVSMLVATILVYLGWFFLSNIILLVVYLTTLRGHFKTVKINRPINYLLGGIFGFLTMMILAFFITNIMSSKVFYNSNNFNQNITEIIDKGQTSDQEKYPNKVRESSADKMFSIFPDLKVQKTGDALAYWFWTIVGLKNNPGDLSDIIETITDPGHFEDNVADIIKDLPEDQKNEVVDNLIGPVIEKIKEETDKLPVATINWSDINGEVNKWKNSNPRKIFNGTAMQEMMNDTSKTYVYFPGLKTAAEANPNDLTPTITDGNKLYNMLKNLYTLGKIAPGAEQLKTFNAIIGKYVLGMTIVNPGNQDPNYQNYVQFSQWF
ncbi:CvpA family protein [Spiroplasma eriocheiris]|uniref:Uncharacterized protein n=1 Tax=Spiroplasma eriocheiris TaxID=315358 RepID=A0A0H3XHX1_9MOLU|nr:CvpA family protein [Spiroplasma eriocheiris]AHF57553.1 hypothetical protein SPE_0424 [Spiroplasma eriocheiris CCTCC M 207170]AKM54010.1 hypothetical protein SERIO_v1c04310 [Spiroplasma eriocheiris]